jgi:RNA 2',3'-cyclic 3'-phosphodiesterase
MRTFIAVELSESIRQALERVQDKLRRVTDDVKWAKPQNLHLTLKFLGDVPDSRVAEVIDLAKDCAAQARPLEMTVTGTGGFPNVQRPRVVFVDAQETPPIMAELALALNRAMTKVDVEFEDRPFRSHITLGRIRRPKQNAALAEALEKLDSTEFGRMTVDRIVLIKSELTPKGPIYSPVEEMLLAS